MRKRPEFNAKNILNQPGVGAAIIGVRNSRHVESNLNLFRFELDDAEIEEIRNFLKLYPTPEGECFELESTPGSRYRNIMKMNLNKA